MTVSSVMPAMIVYVSHLQAYDIHTTLVVVGLLDYLMLVGFTLYPTHHHYSVHVDVFSQVCTVRETYYGDNVGHTKRLMTVQEETEMTSPLDSEVIT